MMHISAARGEVPGGLMAHQMTVADVLELPTLAGTTVVAGGTGLARTVRHVGVVAGTEITRWVKPQAVLLSTAHPFRERLTDIPAIITELHERAVSCLAVRLGSYLDGFPADLLDAADAVGLPIVQLTDTFAFDDILLDILSRVNMTLAADLELAERVHATLTDIVLSGGSLARISSEVSRILRAEVALMDPAGEPIEKNSTNRPAADWRRLEAAARDPRADQVATDHIVLRIGNGTTPLGYLECRRPGTFFSGSEVRALERSCTVAALALTQQAAVHEVELQYQGEILGRVVRGELTDPDEIGTRFHDVGWHLDGPCLVACLSVSPSTHRQGGGSWWLRTAALLMARADLGRGAAVTMHAGHLVMVVAADRARHLQSTLERVTASFDKRAAGELNATITAGLSTASDDLAGIARAYRQAEVAATAARRRARNRRVCRFEELGVLGVVLASAGETGLADLEEAPLAPLEGLPARARQDLMETLRAVMEVNMNLAEASRVLHCHYNTIRDRVRRLEELLGPFTTDQDVRLSVSLALRLRDFST